MHEIIKSYIYIISLKKEMRVFSNKCELEKTKKRVRLWNESGHIFSQEHSLEIHTNDKMSFYGSRPCHN